MSLTAEEAYELGHRRGLYDGRHNRPPRSTVCRSCATQLPITIGGGRTSPYCEPCRPADWKPTSQQTQHEHLEQYHHGYNNGRKQGLLIGPPSTSAPTCATCNEQIPVMGRGRPKRYCDRCHPRRDCVAYIRSIMPLKDAARQLVKDTHARIAARAEASPDNTVRRICQAKGCGTEFTVTGRHERRYCNETCRNRKHGSIRTTHETINCENCGTTVGKYDGGATLTRPRRFCSPACKGAWNRTNPEAVKRARERARSARRAARKQHQKQYDTNPRTCATCHNELPYEHRNRKRCPACQAEHEREQARQYHHVHYRTDPAYRAKLMDAAHRRHARRKTNGPVHNIKRRDVFKRDNYRCRICGVTTDDTLPRAHPRRSNLGHINAIAAGGTHTWDNVCCLCYSCNRADGVNQLPIQTSILDHA